MTKYYADAASGRYLGGVDGAPIYKFDPDTGERFQQGFAEPVAPANSVEVPEPPPGPADFYTHSGGQWIEDADRADREADAAISAAFESEKLARLMFEINFDQENRLRALEGQAALDRAAYRAGLAARVKALA